MDVAEQLNNAAQGAVQSQQQQIAIPDTVEVNLRVNVREVVTLLEGLGYLPMNRAQVIAGRVQAMLNQAALDFINPPKAVSGLPPRGEPMMGDEDGINKATAWRHQWHQVWTNTEAHKALAAAEAARRGFEGKNADNGTLDVQPAAHPDDDYAAATTFISHAVHHLDEGLPNGQRTRCTHAYAALRYGVWKLGQFLDSKLAIKSS